MSNYVTPPRASPAPPDRARRSSPASAPRSIDGVLLTVVNVILRAAIGQNAAGAISLAIGIAYFGFLEGSNSGQTIGKRALGIRVIDYRTGGPLGFGRAVLRYFARFLSALPCLLGYFWMLWDKERQTWHDKLISDVVVPTSAYPVASWPN